MSYPIPIEFPLPALGFEQVVAPPVPLPPLIDVLPGMHVWWDVQDTPTITLGTGNDVTSINDKSGNGRTLSSVATGFFPQYDSVVGINGHPAIGSGIVDLAYMQTVSTTSYTGSVMVSYSVFHMTRSGANFRRLISCPNGGSADATNAFGAILHLSNSSALGYGGYRSSAYRSNVSSVVDAVPYVAASRFDGSNHSYRIMRVDTKAITGGTPVATSGTFNTNFYRVGNANPTASLTQQWNGQWGEHLVYRTYHTDEQMNLMLTFLAEKWD